ncbi:TPA: AlpA family phage regulatory protein [Burkholderia vietnamiensis]|nr:AlpA family phage regulatory protein [Burkholderia vietnamiensis]
MDIPDSMLTGKEVCRVLNIGRTTFFKIKKEPTFPKPRVFSKRIFRWLRSEVLAYRELRITRE